MKHQIDKLDKKILKLISQNARVPFLEVARECNVSGAAIHQRVQKLTALGVVKGSEFVLDTKKIGYHTCAYVGISIASHYDNEKVIGILYSIPEIAECHYTTGRFALFVKIYAHDNRHLLDIVVNKITKIEGVEGAETFLLSLDEVFNRQISAFNEEEENEEEEA